MTNPAAMKPAVPAAGGSLAGLSGASLASMATLHGGAGLLNAAGQNQFAGQLGGALGGQNALAASRRARRLHIGNLPQGVGLDAQMLKQFFNAALVSASLHDTSKEGDPVLDTMIAGEGRPTRLERSSHHSATHASRSAPPSAGKFGFVEFRTIAEAISCIALNGIELGGKQLRIERPRDYTPMPDSMHEELKAAGVMGSTSVAPDGKDLLNPATAASAAPANLTVGGAPLAALTGPAAGAGLPPLDTSAATSVLNLAHMVTAADAASDSEMTEILEDTKLECEKHGKVVECASPKPGVAGEAPGLDKASLDLRVFVKFETQEAAVAAAKELHGKQFDGRVVAASFVSEETYALVRALDCHTFS